MQGASKMNDSHSSLEVSEVKENNSSPVEHASTVSSRKSVELAAQHLACPGNNSMKNDDKDPEQTDVDFDDNVSDITTVSNPRRYNISVDDDHNRGLTITLERSSTLMPPTHQASQDSKFHRYFLLVDLSQNDRAVEIILASLKRPHMRSFHFAWISFFICFFLWFSLSPLMGEVEKSLDLTKQQLWLSNIYSVVGCAVLRITIGPLCDRYGARVCVCVVMFVSAISTTCQSAVKTPVGLYIARAVVGFSGSSFVTSICWTSSMFTKEVAGTANAIATGWGNLGGGAAQLIMGTILVPLLKWIYSINSTDSPEVIADKAWRTAIIIPGVLALIVTFFIFRFSDDSPKGDYRHRQQHGLMNEVSARKALFNGLTDRNTLALSIQYGCSFGVETTINNLATIYFIEEFGISPPAAAATASVFGVMNIFARGLGGFISDYSYACKGMRGRLISHTVLYVLEGLMLVVFASAATLPGAIISLAIFSIFVQMAEGSTYGIVPNVNPRITGSITGIVGAGGNVGAIFFFFLLSQYPYRVAMKFIGCIVLCSAILSCCICIPGHSSLFNIKSCNERVVERHVEAQDVLEENASVLSNVVVIPSTIQNNHSHSVPRDEVINGHSSSENGISPSQVLSSTNACVEENKSLQYKTTSNSFAPNGKMLLNNDSKHSDIKAYANDDINLHLRPKNSLENEYRRSISLDSKQKY